MLRAVASISVASASAASLPCDIYAADGAPCVAAHSLTRALFAAYSGPLYQVNRTSDGATLDIKTTVAGGPADAASQDAFCGSNPCVVQRIYDQTSRANHLDVGPPGGYVPHFDIPVNASRLPTSIYGQKVYGAYFENGAGYRIDRTYGVATGNDPETIYMVTSGQHVNARTQTSPHAHPPTRRLLARPLRGEGGAANTLPWLTLDNASCALGNLSHLSTGRLLFRLRQRRDRQSRRVGTRAPTLNLLRTPLIPARLVPPHRTELTSTNPLNPAQLVPLKTVARELWKQFILARAPAGAAARAAARGASTQTRHAHTPARPPLTLDNPPGPLATCLAVMCDMENGLFSGNEKLNPMNKPLTSAFVTAMVKGGTDGFALKGGDAMVGPLNVMYDGPRPNGYQPMKKQGSIILGIGGDNSDSAIGTFFEGVMCAGYASDAADDAVQANIVAAGYGV